METLFNCHPRGNSSFQLRRIKDTRVFDWGRWKQETTHNKQRIAMFDLNLGYFSSMANRRRPHQHGESPQRVSAYEDELTYLIERGLVRSSSFSSLISTLTIVLTAVIAAAALIVGSLALRNTNQGHFGGNVTIMINQTMNGVLAHTASGVIPPTHAMQTLANDPTVPPSTAAVTVLADATVGLIAANGVSSGGLIFRPTSGGPWNVHDLAADSHTSINDTAGTRVIQAGYPEAFGGNSDCSAETQPPNNGVSSKLQISSANFEGGLLTIYIRSGSELGFDFVTVSQNGNTLYSVSGAGQSPTDAYIEGTVVINMKGTDTITVEYNKDSGCWGGYDTVYVYATLASSPHLEMTIPADLTPYVGKNIEVCSLDTGTHTIELQGGTHHFDTNGFWRVLQFQGNGVESCCAVLSVVSSDRVSILSRDACTVFCSDANLFQCIDPLRPLETNPFHGTWKSITKSYLMSSSFATVDATRVPMSMFVHSGTVVSPSENTYSFSFYPIAGGTFSAVNDTNIHDNHLFPNVVTFQPGAQLFVFYVGRDTSLLTWGPGFGVWEKTALSPQFVPSSTGTLTSLVPDDPVAIFKNYVETVIYEAYDSLSLQAADEKWIGYPAAIDLMNAIITTGTGDITTPITEARVTSAGNNEGITEFRTDTYHHVAIPARVTIAGYVGLCTALNGDFLIAIGATNNAPLNDGTYMDYGPNASARTVHHKVGVFLNSTGTPVLPGTNIANCPGSTPTLTVTYGPITSSTNYIRTMGAIQYWFYEAIKVGLHTRAWYFFDDSTTVPRSGIAHVREEWADVIADVAAGGDFTSSSTFKKQAESRDNTATSAFYPNGVTDIAAGRYFFSHTVDKRYWQGRTDLTGQFGIRPDLESSIVIFQLDNTERSTHWVYIARKNYMDSNTVAYPAWKMIGTTRTHPDNLVAQVVYPGGGGDEFSTVMVPHGTLPPADYSYLWAASLPNGGYSYSYEAEYNWINELNQDETFVGRIDTSLTGGLNIGYVRFKNTQFYDQFSYSFAAEFCPTAHCDPLSFRNNIEALASIYATFMQYLLIDLNCDHIIIDARANAGGNALIQTVFRQFFGADDQTVFTQFRQARKDNGNGVGVSTDQLLFGNAATQEEASARFVSPALSEANYPGSVLTNGEVVFLTDTTAGSGGDIFPNNFLGAAYDGQLGNNTQVYIIGSIDGRITGSACGPYDMPISNDSPRLKDPFGAPVSSFSTSIDCGPEFVRADGTSMANRHLGLEIDAATGLTGLAGGNPLPQDWDELVYKDLGYTTNTRSVLSGWTKPQTPKNVIEVNPLSMTLGSNIVTVTMSAAHGFSTGDDVALGSTAFPVPTTGGIPGVALTGGHNITVTGATTFTFEAIGTATYPGYFGTPASSTVSGVGGSIRITNRSQWRDAWLEASIATVVANAKKRRYDPEHKARKQVRKQRLLAQREAQKRKRSEKSKANLKHAAKMYKRDVSCPDGVTLTPVQTATPTKHVKFDTQIGEENLRSKEVTRVRAEVANSIVQQLRTGGVCISEDGHLMATPSVTEIVKVIESNRDVKVSAKKRKRSGDKKTEAYDTCVQACEPNRNSPTHRACFLNCGLRHDKD
jgi:hypothetical protein